MLSGLRTWIWHALILGTFHSRLSAAKLLTMNSSSADERPVTVDFHTHILPADIPDFEERFGYHGFVTLAECNCNGSKDMMLSTGKGQKKFFRKVEPNCFDPEIRNAECIRDDVDLQVLSTVPVMFSYWAQPADALEVRYRNRLNLHRLLSFDRYRADFWACLLLCGPHRQF